MSYRMFDTGTWQDPWFEFLSPKAKLLFIYLWTNGTCNQAGMYQISQRRIEFEVGFKIDDVMEELKEKVFWDKEKNIVWVKNFFKWQCQNRKFGIAALNSISKLPEDLKAQFIAYNRNLLKKYGIELSQYGINTLSVGYQNSIDTHALSKTGTDTDTDTENNNTSPNGEVVDKENFVNQPAVKNLCPHKEIINLYHEILPELPAVKIWNKTRKSLLQSRWREDPERQSLEWWKKYFEYVRESDFLMGRIEPRNGRPPFKADLEWLIRPSNMAKVLEGRYHAKIRDPSLDDSPEAIAERIRKMRLEREKREGGKEDD